MNKLVSLHDAIGKAQYLTLKVLALLESYYTLLLTRSKYWKITTYDKNESNIFLLCTSPFNTRS